MSEDQTPAADPPSQAPPAAPAELKAFRLRPERPRVTRISRKVLVGVGALGSVAVFGAAIWALRATPKAAPSQELYSTEHRATADGLAALPHDYTGAPRSGPPSPGSPIPPLGPPLPGDLGRPILAAQIAGQAGPPSGGGVPPSAAPPIDPVVQQRQQEREAARLSKLFAGTEAVGATGAAAAALPSLGSDAALPGLLAGQVEPTRTATAVAADQADIRQNGQDHKLAFVSSAGAAETASPDRLQAPASPYVVQAGAVISGALVTGIRSDLPGQITAQVTQNVYDSPTGRSLLIPQGSRLIGAYDAQVSFGQSRVLLVWTRLILPDGRSIGLERQTGADAQGFSGLGDQVDQHWGSLFKAALLSTVLSLGSQAGTSDGESSLVQAIRQGASNSISQVGDEAVRSGAARDCRWRPTRPG